MRTFALALHHPPNGLETGFDSTVFGNFANRIPSSRYEVGVVKNASGDVENTFTEKIKIDIPSAGRYIVQVMGGSRKFTVKFEATDQRGSVAVRKFSGDPWPDRTFVYFVHYSPVHGTRFSVVSLTPFSHFSAGVNVSSFLFPTAQVTANFTLGRGSKGMDPVTEPVSFQFSSYAAKIPAGSFIRNKDGAYSFDGTIQNVSLRGL